MTLRAENVTFGDCADRPVLLASGQVHAAGSAAEVLTADNIAAVFGSRVEVSWEGSSIRAAIG